VPMPTLADLKGFSSKNPDDVAEMSAMLQRFGFPSPDKMVEQQAQYLANFDIRPGDPRYKRQMELLATSQSGRVLMAQARRTQEQYQTLKAVEGDTTVLMIRLAEGDNPCELCEPLDGEIKTYREFVADNQLPGGSSCLGGDNCLCTLTPVV